MRMLTIHARLVCVLVVVIIVLGASAPGSRVPAAAQSDLSNNWLHFGSDSGYTGYAPAETILGVDNVAALKLVWGIGCEDGAFSVISRAPAIRDGVLYSAGAGRELIAQDARTGDRVWSFGGGALGWAPQPVATEEGTVLYLEGISGIYDLYALDATSGENIWQAPLQFDLGFNDVALPTVDEANGVVYFIEKPFMDPGKLFALDLNTGDALWYLSKEKDDIAVQGDYPLVDEQGVYVPILVDELERHRDDVNYMARIDPASQTVAMQYARPNSEGYEEVGHYGLCGDMLVADYGTLYDETDVLVGYNTATPDIAWRQDFKEITGGYACDPNLNVIYVPTNPYLYALDAATGKIIWKYTDFGAVYTPSIANGVIYAIAGTNMVAISQDEGKKLFSYRLGEKGYENTQVAISNGMVYFSGNGGTCDLLALGVPGQSGSLGLTGGASN